MQIRWYTLRLLLLSLLLLGAQVSVAVHSAEHPFHNHVASCDAFLSAQPDQALSSSVYIPTVITPPTEPYRFLPYHFLSVPTSAYSARAPPANT